MSQVEAGFTDQEGAAGVVILTVVVAVLIGPVVVGVVRRRRWPDWWPWVVIAGAAVIAVLVHRYVRPAFSLPLAAAGVLAGAVVGGAWRWRRGRAGSGRPMRWRRACWGLTWTWGWRSGEWWIGARRNLPMDALELNFLGLTLMVGRS